MTTERLRLMGPVIFRIILIIVAGFAVAGLASPYWGLGCVIAGLLAEMGLHLNYIARLDEWLEKSMTALPKTDEESPTAASALPRPPSPPTAFSTAAHARPQSVRQTRRHRPKPAPTTGRGNTRGRD